MSPKLPNAPGRGCAVLACLAVVPMGCGESPQHRSERPFLVWEDAFAESTAPRPRHTVELAEHERMRSGAGPLAVALPDDLGGFDAVVVRGRLHGAHRLELRLRSPAGERLLARHAAPGDDIEGEWVFA